MIKPQACRYWAFISYSHADRRWGDWLHHALETHKIPKALVGQDTQRGEPVPPRVFPVFRDREELPTSANLGAVIGEALRESRYLIVICSPRAAQSRWVNQEILDYKRLDREDRILALIVDGEPNAADGKPGYAPEMECFPEALKHPLGPDGELDKSKHTEPIAADARPDRDGKLNAKLKLLAGVLGVNYDDLKRRDEERRRRRQRVVASISATLVLVFAVLAGAALWQWHEAAAERQQALRTLSQSDFLQANRLIADDRRVEGLAYLVRSLQSDPDNRAALMQLGVQLASRRWMMPILTLPSSRAEFSPDGGRVVALGRDNSLRVWDLGSGEPLTRPLVQEATVRDAHFSADGKRVIALVDAPAGGDACTLRRLDASTGTEFAKLNLPGCMPISSVAFSADGARLAVVSEVLDGLAIRSAVVKVWDTASGQRVWTSPPGEPTISALFSPDGGRLVTTSNGSYAVKIWDLRSGQAVSLTLSGEDSSPGVRFSPDGRKLVTALVSGARVWDAATGKPLTDLLPSGEQTDWVEFSPDGRRVATASAREQDGMARVWDAETGKPVTGPMAEHTDVYEAHFSPDGTRLVIVSGVAAGRWINSSSARIWDAATGAPVSEPLTTKTPVDSAGFSPDGRRLVTTDGDDSQIWDLLPGQQPTLLKGDGAGEFAAFSPDGAYVATAGSKGLQIWDARRGASVADIDYDLSGLRGLRFAPDGKRIVLVGNGSFSLDGSPTYIVVVDKGQPVGRAEQLQQAYPAPVPEISPAADRYIAVVAADRDSARVYALDNGKPLTGPLKSDGSVVLNGFSPDGKLVVTAAGKTARIWDAATGQAITAPLAHTDNVVSAAFSPDGGRLVTGANDSTVRIWDAHNGKLLAGPLKQGLYP
ncbi:MAG TPA: TIR domain-containing protein, partial [Terriglobia bacterium]|nr:TIR domain-containing protein [Terriglobia bacterium]